MMPQYQTELNTEALSCAVALDSLSKLNELFIVTINRCLTHIFPFYIPCLNISIK